VGDKVRTAKFNKEHEEESSEKANTKYRNGPNEQLNKILILSILFFARGNSRKVAEMHSQHIKLLP